MRSPDQIRRQLADNQHLIHEYELQIAGYGGRVCKDKSATLKAMDVLKAANNRLRSQLKKAVQSEKHFMSKR